MMKKLTLMRVPHSERKITFVIQKLTETELEPFPTFTSTFSPKVFFTFSTSDVREIEIIITASKQ